MNHRNLKLSFLLVFVLLIASACKANVSRNGDGSATVETTASQQELQDIITSSIADPLVKDITVSLQSGYITVTGERQRLNDASKTDTLSFRLDLGVSNGQLIASISNAQVDNVVIEQPRIDNWNTTIANRLSNIGSRHNNAALQSVTITPQQVTMTWLVTK